MVGMKRKIIGFLAARLDEPYQHSVWSGAVEEAEKLGITLIFFGGQRLESPVGFEALDNIAFNLAARSHLDALVVMTNVIGTYLTQDEILVFMNRLKKVPLVSVGVEIPGIHSVFIDNSGGMTAIAEHLVKVHRRREFLFLAGPINHNESIAREKEFSQHLKMLLGNEFILRIEYCNFQENEAWDTVGRLISQGLSFDAIVAANDLMAMGALRALAEAGIRVPEEVSVTGFDDTEDSRFSIPPLTTIRQGTCELGRQAIRSLSINLGLLPKAHMIMHRTPVSLVIRESCGCSSIPEHDFCNDQRLQTYQIGSGENSDAGVLLQLANDVNTALSRGRNPATIQYRHLEAPYLEKAQVIIAEGIARYQASLRRSVERRAAVLREIEASLVSSFALTDILSAVAAGTRTLGISACYLALFESKGITPEWARLLLASEGNKTRILAPYGVRFRTVDILPGGLPDNWKSYVVEPLRFGEERLGYLVCTADSEDRQVFEALRDQVSGAIKGALLMTAERDRERNLEHQVRIRTIELSRMNEQLREEIERRRALERELLDISNDIMASIGRDIHDDLCQNIAGIGLMAAILEGNLRRLDGPGAAEAANAAASIAHAASKTASQAKGMARGLYPAELEAKGLVAAVGELVKAAQNRSNMAITLEVSPGFTIKNSEKALHLYRIIQEALNNAVTHSKASHIQVSLKGDRESVEVMVADNGIGFNPQRVQTVGLGLRILKYRSSLIGGELRIRALDPGCCVSCRVVR
ncbi:histidine kinase [Gracilinema caldarium DSM 7334]|uniref:Histidine kinase n=2 Tax=Gracilinema caldarium TaxID=215591 RepID=F8EZW0_GRAC1|nr:histidine kinase [Gracilinema caldarium DSM 7334]